MQPDEKPPGFFISRRAADRRVSKPGHPPFLCEEGLVLVDRRAQGDRRVARQGQNPRDAAGTGATANDAENNGSP